ncbi:MAG: hypothetical protein PHW47_07120 [Lachnospira sp.]|nr:hypothetical protein [Lachnospira sp.]
MDEKKKDTLEFSKEQLVVVGAGVITSAVLGYKVGFRHCEKNVASWIAELWKVNPELKGEMWTTLTRVLQNR